MTPRARRPAAWAKETANKDKPFAVRWDAGAGCWLVRQRANWRRVREITLLAGVITTPTGTMYGEGVVRVRDGCAVIYG